VIERLAPLQRRLHEHLEVLFDLVLTHELVEARGPQGEIEASIVVVGYGLHQLVAALAHGCLHLAFTRGRLGPRARASRRPCPQPGVESFGWPDRPRTACSPSARAPRARCPGGR